MSTKVVVATNQPVVATHQPEPNADYYWYKGVILEDDELIVYKDTSVGKHIRTLIELGYPVDQYIKHTFIEHATPEQIFLILESSMERAFEAGKEHQRSAIRQALGL